MGGRSRPGLPFVGAFYYVADGVIHLKSATPIETNIGVDVTFYMYKTELQKMPASDEAWSKFPLDQAFFGPPTP